MARKRSRSPFPVTQPPFHPSFLSPLRRSIRSFPLLGGVSRRCNLRLNCQSTGYYFPVSLPGRSGRLGAARWPLQEKTERVPWRKLARGGGRGISILAFFSLNRRGGSRAFWILLSTKHFLFSRKLSRERSYFTIADFVDCEKLVVLRQAVYYFERRIERFWNLQNQKRLEFIFKNCPDDVFSIDRLIFQFVISFPA